MGTNGMSPLMLRLLPWNVKLRVADLWAGVQPAMYPSTWKEVELVSIPKEKAQAPTADQLRYLGLEPFGAKYFKAALMSQAPALPPWHVGYAPGGRTSDVVALLRAALFNAAAWTDPQFGCVVLSCDVRRAFDNIEYDVAAQALLGSGVPLDVTELLLTPLLEGRARLRTSSGAPGNAFPMCRGARTGGVESPYLLNCVLAHATKGLARRWRGQETGWGGGFCSSLWWWADNAWILARSVDEASEMFSELTAALRTVRLEWKPSSLEFLVGARAGTAAGSAHSMTVLVGDVEHKVKRVAAMRVLGECLPENGWQTVTIDAALAAAERRWFASLRLWRSKALWRGSKLRQFYTRVVAPLVQESGGWHMATPLARKLVGWERRKLRQLMRFRSRREGEAEGEYAQAYAQALQGELDRQRLPRLIARVARAQVQRAERLNAAQPEAPLAATRAAMRRRRAPDWRIVAAAIRHRDRLNQLHWQRSAPGRPATDWEAGLVRVVGTDWWSQAGDLTADKRRTWEAALLDAWGQPQAARRTRQGAAGMRAASASSRAHAAAAECAFPRGRQGWVVEARTDAQSVASAANGRAKAPSSHSRHAGLEAHAWRSIALHCERAARDGVSWRGADPIAWTPREFNAAADRLAAMAHFGPVDHAEPATRLRSWTLRPSVHARIFSDASLTEYGVTWAALVCIEVGGLWRLAMAAAGRLPPATAVPAAEWHAAAQGWRLESLVRRTASRAEVPPGPSRCTGRPLGPVEVYFFELLVNLAWAPVRAGE